jgi:hypothetical protein
MKEEYNKNLVVSKKTHSFFNMVHNVESKLIHSFIISFIISFRKIRLIVIRFSHQGLFRIKSQIIAVGLYTT